MTRTSTKASGGEVASPISIWPASILLPLEVLALVFGQPCCGYFGLQGKYLLGARAMCAAKPSARRLRDSDSTISSSVKSDRLENCAGARGGWLMILVRVAVH
jgi:hypothetical protein